MTTKPMTKFALQEALDQYLSGPTITEEGPQIINFITSEVVKVLWTNRLGFMDRFKDNGTPEAELVPALAVLSRVIVEKYMQQNESTIVADITAAVVSARVLSERLGAPFDIHTNPLIVSAVEFHTLGSMKLAAEKREEIFDFVRETWLHAQQTLSELKQPVSY